MAAARTPGRRPPRTPHRPFPSPLRPGLPGRPPPGIAPHSPLDIDRDWHVIGEDDRVVVPIATDPPYRHICKLEIRDQHDKTFGGTGWLAGPRTVITAAHCLFRRGAFVQSVRIIPARRGNDEPYKSALVLLGPSLRIARGWREDEPTGPDYGALLMEKPFSPSPGWFAFHSFDDRDLEKASANICGYPGDLGGGSFQFLDRRLLAGFTATRLRYEIDTTEGQSGSPIWFKAGSGQKSRQIVAGIHTLGVDDQKRNSGVRISRTVAADLLAWTNPATFALAGVGP